MQTIIQHFLAVLAYRCAKCLESSPQGYGDYEAGNGAKTPREILSHISDLMDFACTFAKGKPASIKANSWDTEVDRFYRTMENIDRQFAELTLEESKMLPLLQGPLSDAMTHAGQLAMLRRLAGSPISAENFMTAQIVTGKVRYFQPEEEGFA